MTTNGDNTAANRIITTEIDQLEDEVEALRIHEAEAAALAEQFRAEREAREKRLAAVLDDQLARARRRTFRLIVGGMAAAAWLLRRARDHAIITTAAMTSIAVGAGGAVVTADITGRPAAPHYGAPGVRRLAAPATGRPPGRPSSPARRRRMSAPAPHPATALPTTAPTTDLPAPTPTVTATPAPTLTSSAPVDLPGHRHSGRRHQHGKPTAEPTPAVAPSTGSPEPPVKGQGARCVLHLKAAAVTTVPQRCRR
jgi:hypothetical protein